jgi:SAM-dependent methyltransferase
MDTLVKKLRRNISCRATEQKIALRWLEGCRKILDVGCGRGSFMARDPNRICGIDANLEHVEACLAKGLDVQLGDGLKIPHADNAFDGAYCSHVIHVLEGKDALLLMQELSRVVKPGGLVVISSIPFCAHLFFEPADARPYPPQAIRALCSPLLPRPDGDAAPTLSNRQHMTQEDLWLRRPSLIEFLGTRSAEAEKVAHILNLLQYRLFLRKYWTFNGYCMKVRNGPKT